MVWEEVVILIASLIISSLIAIGYRIIKKKWFKTFQWIYAILPIAAFFIVYTISEDLEILPNLKSLLIWTFILEMFLINFKCIIRGSARSLKSGKSFWRETKKSYKDMKSALKKKKNDSDDSETKNEIDLNTEGKFADSEKQTESDSWEDDNAQN